MNQAKLLQDAFLTELQTEKTSVTVFLANGIRLIGKIEAFDAYVVLLKSNVSQLIYKHSIATVVPAASVSALEEDDVVHTNSVKDRQTTTRTPIVTHKRSRVLA